MSLAVPFWLENLQACANLDKPWMFFSFVCGSLLRVFLSDTFWGQLFLWFIARCLFSTKVAFTQLPADYHFRRTANSTRSWSAMAESLAGNMSLPLSVPSFLHLGWKWCWCCNYVFACFCSISQDQFYSYSFLPKAFKAFASIHFLDFLCFWTLL